MATKVSDDVAKYLQAISKTTEGEVARVIPRGLKSEWSPPTGKNLKNIMEYIRSQTHFRFREGTLRNYKYSIRDSLMKLPPGSTMNLERRLNGIRGVFDHAVGLSATYNVAPGYTEAFQILEEAVNKTKGTAVDKYFGPALRATLEGDFSKVDAYNKTAAKFQKNNPGVDVPFIEKGGDPRKTVKYFDQFSPAAQKNILEVAQKGVAIKTGAMPLTEKNVKEMIKNFNEIGIPCIKGVGGQCDSVADYKKGFNQEVAKAAAGDIKAGNKMNKFLKVMRKAKSAAKWTGYGLLAEAGFMVPFAVHDYATGKSWKRILGNATDWGFGPMLGQSEQEEFLAALPEGSKGAEVQELERLGTQLTALEEDKPRPTSRIGMDPRRFEKSQVDMQNKLIDEFNLNLDPFLSDTPYAQGQWHQGMFDQAQQAIIDTRAAIAKKEFERTQKRRKQGIIAEDDWMVGGDTRGYRDGGIAGLLKK